MAPFTFVSPKPLRRRNARGNLPIMLGCFLVCCPIVSGHDETYRSTMSLQTQPCEALPKPLPAAAGVKDPVFAVLIGLIEIESDGFGCLSGSRLESTITERNLRSRLPYQRLIELQRTPEPDGARVVARLDGALDMRMPYRILWYRPARLRTDSWLHLREWSFPSLRVPFGKGSKAVEHVRLERVHVYGLLRGSVEADIDAWLDHLLGAALDDMIVTGLAVFRHSDVWMGLAVGYNRKGVGRSGLFDFERDAIIFPMPGRMRAVARQIRVKIEKLMRVGRGSGKQAHSTK